MGRKGKRVEEEEEGRCAVVQKKSTVEHNCCAVQTVAFP